MFAKKILKGKPKKNRGIFQGLFVLLLVLLATGCSTALNRSPDNNEIADEDQMSIEQTNNLLSTDATTTYYVYTAEDLEAINGGVEGYEDWSLDDSYVLMADIDLSGYSSWGPIGPEYSSAFTGVFDGNGFTITGLTIDSQNVNYNGLFGYTNKAIVKNLTIKECNLSVTGSSVGGIAGAALETAIENCSVSGVITSTSDCAGGIVGSANYKVTLNNCHSSVTITGLRALGGLFGFSQFSQISNSYAIGSVTGSDQIGGLIGRFIFTHQISNSYASVTIISKIDEGENYIGGLVGTGRKQGTTTLTTNCFYDILPTPAPNPVNDFGTKVTGEQMQQKETFSGWDFDSIWNVDSDKNGGYPFLRSNSPF